MTSSPQRFGRFAWILVVGALLFLSSAACSLGEMLVGEPTPTATRAALPAAPTWTPSPVGQLSPAQIATLTVEAAVILPTFTPTPTPMETPTPTATFTPEIPPTETPTATPAPELLIVAPVVNVRQGPSIAYGIIGQVRQDERYQLTGRNDNDSWWQICCIGADLGWITSQLTAPSGPVDSVPIASAPQLPPTPFPSDTPLPTPLPTPSWRFWLSEGPEPWETNNAWLTIWLKTYIGSYPNTVPVPGYRLKVFRNGVDVSQPDMTLDRYQWSAPSVEGDPTAFGNRRQYNLKYEYHPQAGDAEWRIYLVDGSGAAVSQEATFQTKAAESGNEIYVSFIDVRG